MKIVRERPCQRRFHRVTAPMKVVMPDGTETNATNWSLGGLRLDGVKSPLPSVGDTIDLTLELPFQGFDISFDVKAEIKRADEDGNVIGCEFQELSERAHDLLNHFIEDLVRGQMASIEDTICRIDVPVTPISTKPDPNPASDTPVRRWPIKTVVMSFIYLVIGVAVFSYLALLIYSNTMRLEVRSAVVSAPLVTLKMPADGVLRAASFTPGRQVREGETIALVDNAVLTRAIDDKKLEVLQAEQNLRQTEARFAIEQSRMELYKIVNRTDRENAKAKVAAARDALNVADVRYARLKKLFEAGQTTKPKLEEAETARSTAESNLRSAELEHERAVAMETVSDRRYFNHKEFVSDLDLLALEIEAADSAVTMALAQLENLRKQKDALSVVAPYDGRIVSVQQIPNTSVLRNEPLITIEQAGVPTVTAFMDQNEILAVGINDRASVFLPALNKRISATVTQVDRNATFMRSDASHYSWSGSDAKSAAVSLRLELSEGERAAVEAGLPAVVIFPRRQVNELFHQITNVLSFGGGGSDV